MSQLNTRVEMESLTLERSLPKSDAMNHEALYLAGVQYVREYCGKVWTDYNVHDPGMTTLELLSYVLTDVAFRASYPVADLLATGLGKNDLSDQFYSAAQVFVNQALTIKDYRKLLIDIPNIDNAWITPVTTSLYVDKIKGELLFAKPAVRDTEEVNIKGFNKVVLDLSDSATEAQKKAAEKQVQQRLMAHRNLCEDWLDIKRIKEQDFFLCGGIELQVDASVNQVYADILFAVQNYLTPVIKRYTLAEMLNLQHANGEVYSSDEIFAGPSLENGFITDESLSALNLKTEIRLSDIISLIMNVKGVVRIRKLHISPSQISFDEPVSWLVPVAADHKPKLKPEHSQLGFYVDGLTVVTSIDKVNATLLDMQSKAKQAEQAIITEDLAVPRGRKRQMTDYLSIQNHFPGIYGVGSQGLHAGASEEDRNRAKQFKGYLLFFDQVLANFTAQLSHLASLFSSDAEVIESYAFQLVDSFKDYEEIYALPDDADSALRAEKIRAIASPFIQEGDELERRNRFLDHLIARFGEQTSDFAAALVKMFDANAQTLIRYKCNFINRFPEISRLRGTAFNYALQADNEIWDTDNVSGLEKRLAALLGLEDSTRRHLSNLRIDQGKIEILESNQGGFQFRIKNQDNQILFNSPATLFVDKASAEEAVRACLVAARKSENYVSRTANNGKHFFELTVNNQPLTRRSMLFDDPLSRDAARDATIEYVRAHQFIQGKVAILGNDQEGFRFRIINQDNIVILNSPIAKFTDRSSAEEALRTTLAAASVSDNYRSGVSINGKHYFELTEGEHSLAQRSKLFDDLLSRDTAKDALIEYVRTYHSIEGMYLLENILLFPKSKAEPTMPVCVDTGCEDCAELDPYSYRLHIILPAYTERFRNIEFRNYVESVIRREMPAHILPKICWASRDDIALLEISLQKWHTLISGKESSNRKVIMQSVIAQLFATKSIFPTERLVDCDDEETLSRFVVGRTTLGTLDIEED